jgi:polyphosphate kinase 2 (PPK2 family)
MDSSRYRVRPGTKVDLRRWDPADTRLVPGSKQRAEKQLVELTARIDTLQDTLYAQQRRALLIVLQGVDTAGKDGTIRHVFRGVDPLGVTVTSFKVPTAEEAAHDFLWRVHRRVPGKGEIAIFNRSHYEDVLVVRVHRLIDARECARRYRHINAFEDLLAGSGGSRTPRNAGNSTRGTSRSGSSGPRTSAPTRRRCRPPRPETRPGTSSRPTRRRTGTCWCRRSSRRRWRA